MAPLAGRSALAACAAAAACVVTACADDSGEPVPAAPALVLPPVIDLPYVAAGAGSSALAVTALNQGGDALTGPGGGPMVWRIDAPGFALDGAPPTLAAGETATVTVRWEGSAAERIAGAELSVETAVGRAAAEVWAVAGDPRLEAATFAPVTGAGGVVIGASAVVRMPTAPFPAEGRTWTDDRVHLFVPDGYRELDALDLALHFHGHGTTLDATVPAHRYREQVYASGANVVLAVPAGPVQAASGDFGKLMTPAGTAAFIDEVRVVLYRAGRLHRPVQGDVVLTSHSGGYRAVAANLAADAPFVVPEVELFDSLYGELDVYRRFVTDGGRLRSNYTSGGGTAANNMTMAMTLAMAGVDVATAPAPRALRDRRAVIDFTAATHDGSTRDGGAYGERLRWSARHGRRGPRAELRRVVAAGATATVAWLSPPDDDVAGWQVESSPDGAAWTVAAEVDAAATSAQVALTGGAWLRVAPVVPGVEARERQRTDTYRVDPGPAAVLVVDGFDRVVDGSFGALAHDLAARVGAAAAKVAPVHTVAHAAITEDGFDLRPYRLVIWLVGDESTADHSFTAAERDVIDAYLAAGGHVILSGSEIGYELGPSAGGAAWLARVAGAVQLADDAGTESVRGAGPLASLAPFTFGGPGAPYPEEFPDVFATTGAGVALLRYADGRAAAVGLAGRAVLVGFPLELVEPARLDDVIAALMDAAGLR